MSNVFHIVRSYFGFLTLILCSYCKLVKTKSLILVVCLTAKQERTTNVFNYIVHLKPVSARGSSRITSRTAFQQHYSVVFLFWIQMCYQSSWNWN